MFLTNKNKEVDIVYCWVDGNDEEWKAKKALYETDSLEQEANSIGRFIDNQELKYSLRSVEKYAPWINKIFIVTDNQIPKWLNVNHPKIKIIDHSEIIPQDALPTFNSKAIEHCIVNIPELSEYFLYANDDMFFCDYVNPEFFFKKGKVVNRYTKPIPETNTVYYQGLRNAYKLINIKYNKKYNLRPHHNIDAYKKSDVLACYKIFQHEINKTIYNKFRQPEDISRVIYQAYNCVMKNGYAKIMHKIDSDLPLFKKIYLYINKKYQKDSVFMRISGTKDRKECLETFKPKLFCINDGLNTTMEQRLQVKDFYEELFPQKSSYEL